MSVMEATPRYFGTDGIRGKVGASLINPEFVLKLGWAAGIVLSRHHGGKVLIGKDTRISGYMFESALEAGLSAAGMNINLLGPMPTPAIAYLTRTFRAQAGIVISASHNLYPYNGIKFFSIDGTKLPVAIEQAIELQLKKPMTIVDSAHLGKAIRVNDASGRYIEFCKSTFPTSLNLSGLRLVIDCAQGATYHIAPHVFKELGAKVITIANHPDGLNINAQCGATCPDLLKQKVIEEGAHLGIALDGDGDRLIMVDHRGEVVDGDELLFIIAKDYQQKGNLTGGVVGTVMSNFGLEQAMQDLAIPFTRAAIGDRFVIEQLKQLGWLLGGEGSGHIVDLGLTTTGDGIISALQILRVICETGRTLYELKSGIQKLPNVLINIPFQKSFILEQNPDIQSAIQTAKSELGTKGRVLIRSSGTEAVVRVMVEGLDIKQVTALAEQLAQLVQDKST